MSTKRRGWFRFSLFAVAIFATLCCGYLGYYRGYQQGYEEGSFEGNLQRLTDQYYTQIYEVEDLITPWDDKDSDFQYDPLIELIVSSVATETWEKNGAGAGEVRPFPTNHSLVITTKQSGHEEIADLFEQLRRLHHAIPEATLIPKLREIAAGKLTSKTLIQYPKASQRAHKAITEQFDAGITTIEKELGEPNFVGESSDGSFPEWATGKRAAVWDSNGGQVYWVLQETLPEGEALILGWRDEKSPRMERIKLSPTAVNWPYRGELNSTINHWSFRLGHWSLFRLALPLPLSTVPTGRT